jgi:hypothetical protein
MWAIHENRVKKGLGGTQTPTGVYRNHKQDFAFVINNGLNIRRDEIVSGYIKTTYLDNPFIRWNASLDEYPEHHGDFDDHRLYETDNFERMKPF